MKVVIKLNQTKLLNLKNSENKMVSGSSNTKNKSKEDKDMEEGERNNKWDYLDNMGELLYVC
jgi:hypothetical protein